MATKNPSPIPGPGRAGYLIVLVATLIFSAVPPGAQAQTPSDAQVQQALRDTQSEGWEATQRSRQQFGEKLLTSASFGAARFDKNEKVRWAAWELGKGSSWEALLFVLPMIEDEDPGLASNALHQLLSFVSIEVPVANPLGKLRAEQVVPHLAAALKKPKNEHVFGDNTGILLVLAQFRKDPAARALLGRRLKERGYDRFFVGSTPSQWSVNSVGALLAQCEMGRLRADQVRSVFVADPEARLLFLSLIGFITNKALLQYGISLLGDQTKVVLHNNNTQIVSVAAWHAFLRATAVRIDVAEGDRITQELNGASQYKREAIARLYAYYGLTEN